LNNFISSFISHLRKGKPYGNLQTSLCRIIALSALFRGPAALNEYPNLRMLSFLSIAVAMHSSPLPPKGCF